MNQDFGVPPYPRQQLLNDPMANIAMQYGQSIAGQGKIIVEEKIQKYFSLNKIKLYFTVDTLYVMKKLGLLFFPFTHRDWSVRNDAEDNSAGPREDVNAPDLYIPLMGFVTYVLISGYILGSQNRFTPEQLGIQASSALGWSIVEIVILMLAFYVLNASSSLKSLDLIAFCSYKYVCMVAILLSHVAFQSVAYYAILGYTSFSLGFFMLRTLRMLILPKMSGNFNTGGRHNSYLLLAICLIQPILMYFLTKHLVLHIKPLSV